MNPGEMAIAAAEMIELRLLSDPEDSERQKTHHIDEDVRRHRNHGMLEIALAVDRICRRRPQVEHEQRHGDRENAVAQGREALDALCSDAVIAGRQRVLRLELLLPPSHKL